MMIHRTHMVDTPFDEISSSLHMEHSERSLLPSFLVELSSRSMRQMNGRSFSAREIPLLAPPVEDELTETEPYLPLDECGDLKTIHVAPSGSCGVAAIDVSSLRIGETDAGALIAIRGAVVWRSDQGYEYVRCGPLTFHLGHGIEGAAPTDRSMGPVQIFTERAIGRLRNALERWIQREICASFSDSTVLFDGSLTAGTPDNPTAHLARILDLARKQRNVVVAVSKSTKLCAFGRRITSLVLQSPAPCLVDVDQAIKKQFSSGPVRLVGHVYVARLIEDGFAFRVDIDRQVPQETQIETVGRLIASDIMMQGYPETLRLAHIFSTFTANDVIAIQRHLASAYGLRIAPRFSVRRSLFGPFGTGGAA